MDPSFISTVRNSSCQHPGVSKKNQTNTNVGMSKTKEKQAYSISNEDIPWKEANG